MYTIDNVIVKGAKVPLCIYPDRDNFSCDEKRYHILFIEKGSGSISYHGRKELFMGPLLFCLNEEEIPSLIKGNHLSYRSLYFSPEYINNRFTFDNLREPEGDFTLTDIRDRHWLRVFFERTESYFGRLCITMALAGRIGKLFDQIDKQLKLQPDGYWTCRARSFLIELLFLTEQCWMLEDNSSRLFAAGYSEEIDNIILYLYSNYSNKISISELASKFHIDRTTLTKRFKEEVGDTIINSLIKLRVNLAAGMLRDTGIPISEIMYRAGFSDLSYFYRTFKKYTSHNPSEYRQHYSILL